MLTHALRPADFLCDLHTLVYMLNLYLGHTLLKGRLSFLLDTRSIRDGLPLGLTHARRLLHALYTMRLFPCQLAHA